MNGQKIGYIRVSTLDQNTARQEAELANHNLDKLFIDKVSGKNLDRPQLREAMNYLRSGDTLYVHSMDRLARNLLDLRSIVQDLSAKHVKVEFLKENLVFTGEDSPMSLLLLSVMGAFAEFERSLIRERQREGIAAAKSRGVYAGRKPSLNESMRSDIQSRLDAHVSKTQICKDYGIARQTLYSFLAKPADSVISPSS